MLTGAAIEVSSTPLPRAVPLTPGAAGRGGAGGNLSAVNSSDAEDRRGSSWQQQQKFAAVAAEKKDKMPVYAYQPEQPPSSKVATAATAGVGCAGAGGSSSSSNACWSGNRTERTAAASTTAAPASADRSWRASYASSLYCLLPAWLLRFRGPAYSPLRDDACATAASSPPAASCSSTATAAGSATTGGGAGGTETPFGDAPFSTVCLHCHKAIITTVAFKLSCLGVCLCLLSPLLLGWPGLCLSPFLYIALKDAVHTCPQCRNLIHRQSRISVPFFGLRDEVVTVKCGNCAVVLSRRYFLLFAALLLLILLFYILRAGWLGSSLDVISKGPPANMSWQQFYEQCGQRSQLGNSLKAGANFRKSFAGKTVEWKGLVKQVKEGFFSSNVLLVVMSPTITLSGGGGGQSSPSGEGESSGHSSEDESSSSSSSKEEKMKLFTETGGAAEGGVAVHKDDSSSSGHEDEDDLEEEAKAMQGDGADLALAFSGSELIEKIEKLEPGDKIEFEATLVALGRRGKPSLGRLWNVSLVEKREAREARLEEWRAKKAERQHLLQRLLLPLMGSPFSDFGFEPFSSFFSSTGSLGGRGMMVIRRQIISPSASFSVISSSSSDDEPSIGLPSVFERSGSISIDGVNSRRHEDEEEKQLYGGDTGKYADANDLLDFGGIRRGHRMTEKHYGVAGKFGDEHAAEGEQLVIHVDEEEEHLQGATRGEMKFEQQPQEKPRSHRMPAWSGGAGDDDDDTMRWNGSRHAERGGDSGLYFHINDEENEEHQHAGGNGAGAARGPAATASLGAETKYEKKPKPPQQSHESIAAEEGEYATLAALKLAVERQRQQRAQQEELEQQRQQLAHREPQKQPQHREHRHPQHRNQQASVVEKEKEGGVRTSPDIYAAPLAGNLQGHTEPQQNPRHMHGEGGHVKRPGEAARGTEPVHAAYIPAAAGVQHEREQQQTEDVHGKQGSVAYETKAPVDSGVAPVQHVQQQGSAMADARSAESRAAESSSKGP